MVLFASVRSDDDHAAQIKTLTKKIQCKSPQNVSHPVVHKPNEIVRLSEYLKWSRFMTEAVRTYRIVSACKRKIKIFEENFEDEFGYRVSTS